mmetsp:Transcript_23858/g.56207  ORF Transcript_23858/g.56207 Transcript_23858/m.56207 type:complete len:227 (+) Transcript_23858:929-1609(+)
MWMDSGGEARERRKRNGRSVVPRLRCECRVKWFGRFFEQLENGNRRPNLVIPGVFLRGNDHQIQGRDGGDAFWGGSNRQNLLQHGLGRARQEVHEDDARSLRQDKDVLPVSKGRVQDVLGFVALVSGPLVGVVTDGCRQPLHRNTRVVDDGSVGGVHDGPPAGATVQVALVGGGKVLCAANPRDAVRFAQQTGCVGALCLQNEPVLGLVDLIEGHRSGVKGGGDSS